MPHRNTWLLLVILAGLVGLGWFLNQRAQAPAAETATPLPTAAFLYAPESGVQIVKFRLGSASGEYTQLERGADGAWVVETAASRGIANPSSSEMAATQVGALRILNTLDSPPALDAIGLEEPQYTLVVSNSSGQQVFQIGTATVTGSGYYARDANGTVVIVGKFGLDALLNLLSAPPFAQTPTPGATSAP